ncbi:MAG: hypothetical protein Q8Q60_01825 [Candidatus Chromulinivorax sp.]|nr:hypothetical protein [Candidatus Chromulinivorax sp.]
MGILSGMLIAAGVAFFTKKKLQKENNPHNLASSPIPDKQDSTSQVERDTASKTDNRSTTSIDKILGKK